MRISRFYKEGVLHFSCWMVGFKIQRVEVIPFRFQFWAFGDFPAHADKNIGGTLLQELQRMASAMTTTAHSGGHIDGFFHEHASFVFRLQLLFSCCERFIDLAAGLAHPFAGTRSEERRVG